MAVRTTEPMLKSCAKFSIATWNGCRRASRSATIAVEPPVAIRVDDVAPVTVASSSGSRRGHRATAPTHGPTPTSSAIGTGTQGTRTRFAGSLRRCISPSTGFQLSSLALARPPGHQLGPDRADGDHLRRVRAAGRVLPARRHPAVRGGRAGQEGHVRPPAAGSSSCSRSSRRSRATRWATRSGRRAGPSVFRRPDSRLFRPEYVDRTRAFFEKYGASRSSWRGSSRSCAPSSPSWPGSAG